MIGSVSVNNELDTLDSKLVAEIFHHPDLSIALKGGAVEFYVVSNIATARKFEITASIITTDGVDATHGEEIHVDNIQCIRFKGKIPAAFDSAIPTLFVPEIHNYLPVNCVLWNPSYSCYYPVQITVASQSHSMKWDEISQLWNDFFSKVMICDIYLPPSKMLAQVSVTEAVVEEHFLWIADRLPSATPVTDMAGDYFILTNVLAEYGFPALAKLTCANV